jgi:Fic family protein
VKSYHTNLTLYTAPDNSSVIRELRKDLNRQLGLHSQTDPLLHMALCHYQIRALAPFTELNHHSARTYTQLWIRQLGLNFHFLPIARLISTKRETYQSIMRDMAAGKTYGNWGHFIVDVVHEAANYLLDRIRELQALRKTTQDILEKYTAYHLPAVELMPVMFSRPFIKPRYIIEQLDCHRHTAYAYLDHLVKAGLLIEKKAGREKLYLHKALFDVLSN